MRLLARRSARRARVPGRLGPRAAAALRLLWCSRRGRSAGRPWPAALSCPPPLPLTPISQTVPPSLTRAQIHQGRPPSATQPRETAGPLPALRRPGDSESKRPLTGHGPAARLRGNHRAVPAAGRPRRRAVRGRGPRPAGACPLTLAAVARPGPGRPCSAAEHAGPGLPGPACGIVWRCAPRRCAAAPRQQGTRGPRATGEARRSPRPSARALHSSRSAEITAVGRRGGLPARFAKPARRWRRGLRRGRAGRIRVSSGRCVP